MQLFSFRISIGNNKSSLVPNDAFNDFYKQVTFSILKTDISVSNFLQLNIPVKPPLNTDWQILNDSLSKCFSAIKNSGEESCVLLHINEVIKPTNYHEIITLFEKLKHEIGISAKGIIFLNNEGTVLSFNPTILPFVGVDKELIFLNEQGEYTFSNTEKKAVERFNEHYNTIQLTVEDKLKLKLVRKLGHFIKEKNGKHVSCQKYFYDGSHCISEITVLLHEQIISKIETSKSFGIYFHSPHSNWARNCFLQIHEDLKKSYSEKYFEQIIKDEFDQLEQVVLLIDVVVSGTTLREIYNEILAKNNQVKIIAFCVIECGSNKLSENLKGIVEVVNGGSNIELNYLLQRNQVHENAETNNCEMCKPELNVPKKKFDELEIEPELSSFEMWSMAIESGLHQEHTPPPDKKNSERFSHNIPNTLSIVKFNGAYLASKFQELLKHNNIMFPTSGFIAYPDETNNAFTHYQNLTADKVPSNLFISSLKLIYRYNILPIPRLIIEEIKNNPSLLSAMKTNHPDFFQNQLLRVKNEPLIIIDEFPRTYRTYEAMRKILTEVSKTPLAYVTLFNFSPDQVLEKVADTKHLNFYEFQLD